MRKVLIIFWLVMFGSVSTWAFGPGGMAATTQPATTQPAVMQPTEGGMAMPSVLAVRVVQGTADGPAVQNCKVTVGLVHNRQNVNNLEGVIDEHGVAMFEGFPVAMGVYPVVTVVYKDVPYTVAGTLMDSNNPQQTMEVKVYETTDVEPDWTIAMRRIQVTQDEDGLRFTDVVVVNNPTDRAWTGKVLEGEEEKQTVYFMLPTNLLRPQAIQEFDHQSTRLTRDGKLTHDKALRPGQTQFQFAYTLPVHEDHVHAVVHCPVETRSLVMMFHAGQYQIQAPSMVDRGTIDMHNHTYRYFQAENLASGTQTEVMINGVDLTKAMPGQMPPGAGGHQHDEEKLTVPPEKIVAGVVAGGLILLAGLISVWKNLEGNSGLEND